MRRTDLLLFGLLFVVAALARALVTYQLSDLPSFQGLVVDAQEYDRLAREIIARGWLPDRAFFQSPLYPYFLALLYRLLGPSLEHVRVVQILLSGLSAVLIALAARSLGGRACAFLAGALAALYAPFLFYAPLILKPTLVVLLEAAFLCLALPAAGRPRGWMLLSAGACLGLLVLLRGNALLLAASYALWVLVAARPPARNRAWSVTVLFLGLAAVVAPATVLNYRAEGELILSTWNAGGNFYIGNRPGASGIYEPLVPGRQGPQAEQEDARKVAAGLLSARSGGPVEPEDLSPAATSRILWRETWRQIGQRPGSWIRLLGRKLLLFWNRYEVPDAEDYYLYRRHSPLLGSLPLGFGLVAPLGLLGLVEIFRSRKGSLLLTLVVASCASVVPFFVLGRYRLPVVVFLIPPAALALVSLARHLRRGRWDGRFLAVRLAWLAAFALLVNLPLFDLDARRAGTAVSRYNLGATAAGLSVEVMERDPHEGLLWSLEAESYLREALEVQPDLLPARIYRGLVLLRRGNVFLQARRFQSAVEAYIEAERSIHAASISPAAANFPDMAAEASDLLPVLRANLVSALTNLGGQLIEAADYSTAKEVLRQAVDRDSTRAEARFNLALALLEEARHLVGGGRPGAAADGLEAAQRLFVQLRDEAEEAGEGPAAQRAELALAAVREEHRALHGQSGPE